ncbi:MAG: DUF268 domain-containing protein [Sedimentisphaerales bacterium]|nr:DUF268 domain-containing protein [Sedimentisphaerales bacterium]
MQRLALKSFFQRWRGTLLRPPVLLKWPFLVGRYCRDWYRYQRMPEAPKLTTLDSYPCLYERTITTFIDKHYFYQGLWAMRRIAVRKPERHVDVGSDNRWVGWLTTWVPVTSIDIRPLDVEIDNLECRTGSVVSLPFSDESVDSLSCLHVVEHVGLGRYGDPLDPQGTARACGELSRVIAPAGMLYLSLPIGTPRVCFNAHRVTDPMAVLSYCRNLTLHEFSVIDDNEHLIVNTDPQLYREATYACGLYIFSRN